MILVGSAAAEEIKEDHFSPKARGDCAAIKSGPMKEVINLNFP